MTKTNFQDKYPILSIKINKNETTYKSVDEILEKFKNNIKNHKIAKFISIFDNYEHTSSIDGEINPDIINAKIIIFCFGPAIPNEKVLAIRPRSFGVSEFNDYFSIDCLEAPNEKITQTMIDWAKEIKNK